MIRGTGLTRQLLAAAIVVCPALVFADVRLPRASHVEIRGTGAMVALARLVAERYMSDHPEAIVTVTGGGAVRGLKSVVVGTADLALATDRLPDEIELLSRAEKVNLISVPIYSDAVVPIVHPKNPVSMLWMNQLKDIFRGAIKNWKEVGGDDSPIEVVSFDPSQGAYETFKREVLGDDAVITPQAKLTTSGGLDKAIAENSIGYFGLRGAKGFKALRVNGIEGTTETVRSGAYPIRRHLTVYYREDGSKGARDVVEYFLAKDKGQAIALALGGVPIR